MYKRNTMPAAAGRCNRPFNMIFVPAAKTQEQDKKRKHELVGFCDSHFIYYGGGDSHSP